MADFNALEALINAHIKKNGVQAITGNILNGILRGMVASLGKGYTIAGSASPATDPGTMTGPLAYIAYTAGTYTHFGGLEVEQGEVAMLIYNEAEWHKEVLFSLAASATIDGNVGTPEVGVSFVDGQLTFDFRNMKGNPGDPAGFGTVNATVDDQIGTPSVSVQSSGPDTAKNFTFAFHNLKGETGVTSVVATVDNTSGTPSCAVSLQGQQLTLAFTGLKGAQGNTGVSADYPIAIINNLTTDDPASALSAAQGVVLDGKVSQLEAKVTDLYPDLTSGITYTTNVNVGATVSTTPNTTPGWYAGIFDCEAGDVFYFNATGGSGARLWCFTDEDYKCLSVAPAGTRDETVTAPTNAKHLFVNINNSNTPKTFQKIVKRIDTLEEEVAEIESKITNIDAEIEGIKIVAIDLYSSLTDGQTYTTDVNVGSTVSTTPSTNPGWKSGIIDCVEGDLFYFNATGGSGARLWCFTDEDYKCLSNSPSGARNETVIAPTNAKHLFVNVNDAYTPKTFRKIVNRFDKLNEDLSNLQVKTGLIEGNVSLLDKAISGGSESISETMSSGSDTVDFPFVAKAGDVIRISVSAPGVIGNTSTDYQPLFANTADNYLGTIWDGCVKEFTLPVDLYQLHISGRSAAFIAAGTITLTITNNSLLANRVAKLEEDVDSASIVVPSSLVAVVGHQFNIYLDSVVLCKNMEDFKMQWAGAFPANNKALKCGLRCKPTGTSANNISLTISDKVTGEEIVKKTINLKAIADSEVSGKKVIFIGDSLTDSAVYPAEVQYNLSGGGIESLGTRKGTVTIDGISRTVNHEGRSGWSAKDYTTKSTYNGVTNAFWNPNTSEFDFSYYMTQQGYSGVDVVCLCLGTNGYTNIDECIDALDEMIASVHSYDADIIILVSMLTPPAYQDGVGYKSAYYSADGTFVGMMKYNERILQEYETRNDNVYVLPWHINLNREYDFPTVEEPFSERNPTIVTRQNNNVHPSIYGYLAMADAMYCVLLDKLTS